ncbi:MAG: putative anti-sigma regulatory factor, serine/threonine protein kinase [Streptosporangiaceae bacterium]|nr:putative anti-sigma regulatory factor, serine/threonine protein kinase [Streptosporangiaceae bacterium]
MVAEEIFSGPSGQWLRSSGVMVWRRAYPGRMDQAASARKLPAYLLADTGRGEDAEWIAAELVSNALLYTRSGERGGWFGIEVMLGERAQIAVRDLGGRGVPRVSPEQAGGQLREHGRGLLGVSRLARAMGFSGSPDLGHTVWAQLDIRTEPQRPAS